MTKKQEFIHNVLLKTGCISKNTKLIHCKDFAYRVFNLSEGYMEPFIFIFVDKIKEGYVIRIKISGRPRTHLVEKWHVRKGMFYSLDWGMHEVTILERRFENIPW